ncbi:MAG TPA: hypothetical protein VF530_17930 [Planctomycetota bacterium]
MRTPLPAPASAGPVAGRGSWKRAALFLLGFAVLLALLGRADPLTDVPVVGAKLAHFRRHVARYDTLFLGSSLVHRQVSPAVYDAELAARGLPSSSFNFGILGMVPPESYYLLERILDERPPNLRTVFLELSSLQLRVKREHTRRFDYWHSPRTTLDVVRGIRSAGWDRTVQAHQVRGHLEAALRKVFHCGQGPALLRTLFGPDDPAALGPDGDGWLSTEDDTSNRIELRRELGELEEEELGVRLGALRAGGGAGAARREGEVGLELLARAIARVRAAGATPILLVPPRHQVKSSLAAHVRAHLDVEILEFDDPARYPELYAPELRFDLNHLNRDGAALFSRLLAQRHAEMQGR